MGSDPERSSSIIYFFTCIYTYLFTYLDCMCIGVPREEDIEVKTWEEDLLDRNDSHGVSPEWSNRPSENERKLRLFTSETTSRLYIVVFFFRGSFKEGEGGRLILSES